MESITTPALVSIIALFVIVVIACVKEELNVGFLSISFAILVGGIWGSTSGTKVLTYFPTGLFMMLVGVTFLFGIAQTNGTMEKFTTYSIRLCKGNVAAIPFIVFLLINIISFVGPGNIGSTALMAPLAMAIAARAGMPAILMCLLVAGAANSSAFSPFAPTGVISNGLIAKMAQPLGLTDLNAISWKIFFNTVTVQSAVTFAGFALFGGFGWVRNQRNASIDMDEMAPKPAPFDRAQIVTLCAIVTLILVIILPGIPGMKTYFPKEFIAVFSNVGTISFILASALVLMGSGDSKRAIAAIPWGVIMMVCGVTVLIEVMDRSGGLSALVKMIGALSNPTTVNFWLGLLTGIISAYSSSSGVVMPMFLPMVPGLINDVGGGNPISLISSINIGAHLVDVSPLSTGGALCIACAAAHEDKAKLFRSLLVWGLSMSVVGAVICYVVFGVMNF